MESKNDIIRMYKEDQNIIISVNDNPVVFLNKSNNKVDTKKIFDELNICEYYHLELDIDKTPEEKELSTLFEYTKKFLKDLQNEVNSIDYSKIMDK